MVIVVLCMLWLEAVKFQNKKNIGVICKYWYDQ